MQLAAVIILCFSGLYILWFTPYAILTISSSLIGAETITLFTPFLKYFCKIEVFLLAPVQSMTMSIFSRSRLSMLFEKLVFIISSLILIKFLFLTHH